MSMLCITTFEIIFDLILKMSRLICMYAFMYTCMFLCVDTYIHI